MRSKWLLAGIAVLAVLATGCDENILNTVDPEDLAPPLGLTSVTGDGTVTLYWEASNYGEDREGFEIFQAAGDLSGLGTAETIPTQFGTTAVTSYVTTTEAGTFHKTVTGLVNGNTYSFLVVAYKSDGDKVSRPSNIVVDTPRRESPTTISLINGSGQPRYLDVAGNPATPTSISSSGIDILCQSFNAGAGDRPGMVGQNGAQIQDLGYVSTWDEIDRAPAGTGSYPATSHSVEVLNQHVYAVFTGDGYYAKLYITALHGSDYGFDCRVAFQPQAGNNELDARAPVN